MHEDRPNLLIVEDEPDLREMLEDALTATTRVTSVPDGQSGLDALSKQSFDAVVTDLLMPRMTGLAMLNEMRFRGHVQPVIVITGHPSHENTVQALRLGAFDFIEKPFDVVQLTEVIAEGLRVGRRQKDAAKGGASSNEAMIATALARFSALGSDDATSGAQSGDIDKMTEFLLISQAQLSFAREVLKQPLKAVRKASEIGFVFRVVFSLADCARELRLTALAAIGAEAGKATSTLMARPELLDEEGLALLRRVLAWMERSVEALSSVEAAQNEHIELAKELTAQFGTLR